VRYGVLPVTGFTALLMCVTAPTLHALSLSAIFRNVAKLLAVKHCVKISVDLVTNFVT
jgi:hypothetical protein